MRKISQRRVDHALDGLIIKVLISQDQADLRELRKAITFFENAGYDVEDYIQIHGEIDSDLERYGWIKT